MIIRSKSPKETQKAGKKVVTKVLSKKTSKKAVVLALEGELGAGKTEFTKGFAKALGIKNHITSPTFVLMKPYKFPSTKLRTSSGGTLYHIDAYRLKDHHDLEVLGVPELIKQPDNILLIEWSNRVKKILPKKYIKIHIDHIDSKTRKIQIYY